MTSAQLTTDDVRQLLAQYYAGATTVAQEAELMRYFAESTDIPSDLEADRKLFAALTEASSATVPEDLERRILDATCGRRCHFSPWISAAASVAVAVALALAFLLPRGTGDSRDSVGQMVARYVDTLVPADTLRLPGPADEAHTVASASIKPVETTVAEAPARQSAPSRQTTTTDRYEEITDSAGAVRAAQLMDRMLEQSFASVSSSSQEVGSTISSIQKTINRIAQ